MCHELRLFASVVPRAWASQHRIHPGEKVQHDRERESDHNLAHEVEAASLSLDQFETSVGEHVACW
jgi:hypothetical protein